MEGDLCVHPHFCPHCGRYVREKGVEEPSLQVLAGIGFLFDIAENEDTCYASEEAQQNLKAAGEWYARVKPK